MKASDLHLGDIVGVCYKTFLIASEVVVLEPNAVHLSNRIYPDSDRDIVGIPLSENWLTRFKFSYDPALIHWSLRDVVIRRITIATEPLCEVESKTASLKISFVHELQDLLHFERIKINSTPNHCG